MAEADGNNSEKVFTVKELLIELRRDVALIDAKLDNKADRQRVHDLANEINVIKLERAGEATIRLRYMEEFRESQRDLIALKVWRNRLAGGLVVVASAAGGVVGKLLGLF